MANAATWARWNWKRGLGRGHRLFTDGDLTKTACGKARKTADHKAVTTYPDRVTAAAAGVLCPVCDALDMVLDKVLAGNLTHDIKPLVLDPVAPVAVPDDIVVPVGVCICGAALCNVDPRARDIRDALAKRDAAAKAAARAGFDAYLAAKADADKATA